MVKKITTTMIDERLLVTSPDGNQIMGRLYGDENSSGILFMVHGFGVKSDSRGMYNKLAEIFGDRFLTVRFHLGSIDSLKNSIVVPSYSKQVETFESVIDAVLEKYPGKKFSIVAHSQGCYIASLLLTAKNYNVDKVFLISPSIRNDISEKLKSRYKDKDGSLIDETKTSKLVRSDGSVTLVPSDFWKEADSIDTYELFSKVETNFDATFIWPKGDINVKPDEYRRLISLKPKKFVELEGNHELREDNWEGLINLLNNSL
ncbi:MAG TPA: alpha/beta hydrolase [Candidatus Dojkabacteria bacterium]|nr:alpha/beta hydrolase [Candidatus Dojkabacteria bacterium]